MTVFEQIAAPLVFLAVLSKVMDLKGKKVMSGLRPGFHFEANHNSETLCGDRLVSHYCCGGHNVSKIPQHFLHNTIHRGVKSLCCVVVALFVASKRSNMKAAYVTFLLLADQDASNKATSNSPSSSIFCDERVVK